MGTKERQRDTSKVEVGEIDTRAPFQSVKDAVTLFGEGAFSGERSTIKKTRPHSVEGVLAKESQLHLAQKKVDKLKNQIKNAETTKMQALAEIERAKITVDDLTQKLKTVNESKASAIKATEDAKSRAKQIEETKSGDLSGSYGARMQDLEATREQYVAVFTELDAAKQELWKIRQDCDASLEAKLAAISQAAEAEQTAKANADKAGDISKEIRDVKESIEQVKLATLQAQQEQTKIFSEKDVERQSYTATLEASVKKLLELKKQYDPDAAQDLQKQLNETVSEIDGLQKQMKKAKASDLDSVRTITSDLDGAKGSLQKVAEVETSLRNLLESLKLELENVKKEHSELMEKEVETETVAGNLHVKLCEAKSELEAVRSEESNVRDSYEKMILTLQQLSLEAEYARQEAEVMKSKAEDLKREAESTKIALEEVEKELGVAMEEAEEAKMAEQRALDQIKTLSERTSSSRVSTFESGGKITISREEFEALSQKVEGSESLAKMKVAAAMAQVEAVKASENEAHKKLELMQKEIDDMKTKMDKALKRAEMAEAAKRAVEGELRRWREQEQKKAAETASQMLAETEKSSEASPHQRIQKQNPTLQKAVEVRKLEKGRSLVPKNVLLPNLSDIFHRKKNQVESGYPSYLPGEKPI